MFACSCPWANTHQPNPQPQNWVFRAITASLPLQSSSWGLHSRVKQDSGKKCKAGSSQALKFLSQFMEGKKPDSTQLLLWEVWGVISAAKRLWGPGHCFGAIHLSLDIPAFYLGVELEGRRSQQSPAPSLCGFNSQRGFEMQNSCWGQWTLLHPSGHISGGKEPHVFSQLSQAFILP